MILLSVQGDVGVALDNKSKLIHASEHFFGADYLPVLHTTRTSTSLRLMRQSYTVCIH